ncbi:hypothetical protein PNEG_04266 [Pneumocystis murina B123]|uniref:Uncharacterized protein n=1 Tax=Pneumocystis murina (strain B123) TaxID=1069680 RepID=A0A0W4ZX30_PNEMU|nr:hypothetical protein PNEG_04266 [Pneumocystis murina B123]KTW32929.1 hypothetical protein PNEG_04266 [Pneumocystis murina B123]
MKVDFDASFLGHLKVQFFYLEELINISSRVLPIISAFLVYHIAAKLENKFVKNNINSDEDIVINALSLPIEYIFYINSSAN